MLQNDLERIQQTLVSALDVRHHVTSLLSLAHQINLVSLNAQISSAQIGEAGRVFSVMTSEITNISSSLHGTVEAIRALTHEWAKIIAVASLQMRRFRSYSESINLFKEKGFQHGILEGAATNAKQYLNIFEKSYPRLVGELLVIVDGMEKSMKIVNYVKIGILIESERLGNSENGERSPFQHLANEMQVAAEKIREIAQQTLQQLRELSFEVEKKSKRSVGVN